VKKFLKVFAIVTAIVTAVLFVIYFWDLDSKLMAWAYTNVNRIFDNKKTETKF
jgi:hypothetical protein